jgi:hypothetical protein
MVVGRVLGDCLPSFTIVELHPIILSILNLSAVLQGLSEQVTKEVVVRSVLEAEIADVAQVLVELVWWIDVSDRHRVLGRQQLTRESFAQLLDGRGLLLLSDLLVLLLVGSSLQTLPGKPASQKIHEDMTQCLQIVSSRLLTTKMGVDTHVTGSSRQTLAFPVGDVLLRLGVSVLLGHAEIDNMDNVGSLRSWPTDQEVVGLDVAIDQVLLVNGLYSRQLCTTSTTLCPCKCPLARPTICFATITTVLIENRLLQ